MLKVFFALMLTTCVSYAEPASLGWWFLPDFIEDLPHFIEEDNANIWSEIWVRSQPDSTSAPSVVMENVLGARWIGINPDKSGKPSTAYLVLGEKRVVQFTGDQVRLGIFDEDKIIWSDKTKQSLVGFKRHRRGRRRHVSARMNFGKITIPPKEAKAANLAAWSVEGMENFLTKLSNFSFKPMGLRDISIVSQLDDANGGLLNFRYASSCDFEDRQIIENALAEIEPKLSCWLSQNPQSAWKIPAILLQKPIIDCRKHAPMTSEHCGMATLPLTNEFFVTTPRISLNPDRCHEHLGATLFHEIAHLTGIKDDSPELDVALSQSESCAQIPAKLEYQNNGEGFLNEFQVDTRMYLFTRARQDAVEKWGWSEGEQAFLLGTICTRMGDKYCARRYFQAAAQGNLNGLVELPESGEISLATIAQFGFYDSITEDLQRMHELAKYLTKDPNGNLIRRLETGIHRVHEFFVARTALQAIKENKGICNGDTDDHVMCEDLAQIIKSKWFQN